MCWHAFVRTQQVALCTGVWELLLPPWLPPDGALTLSRACAASLAARQLLTRLFDFKDHGLLLVPLLDMVRPTEQLQQVLRCMSSSRCSGA